MSYDNHLNGCIFFYDGVGKGVLQLRAGNNRLVKLDAKFHQDEHGAWWLAAGRAKDGKLRVQCLGAFTLAEQGRLKGTVELHSRDDQPKHLGTLNVWVAATVDGTPFLQLKPRTDNRADRSLPL